MSADSSCRISASERPTWMTTGWPATVARPLRILNGTSSVGSAAIPPSGSCARTSLPGTGSRLATAVRKTGAPSSPETTSQGLSSAQSSPSNQVSVPSGPCWAISAAQRKSPRNRSSRLCEALRATRAKTAATYTISTSSMAATWDTVRRTRRLRGNHQRVMAHPPVRRNRRRAPYGST